MNKQVTVKADIECQEMEEHIRNEHIDIQPLLTECLSVYYEQAVKDIYDEVCK